MKKEAKVGSILVGGQPSDEEIAAFRERGYGVLVNVRMPEEHDEPQAPKAEAAGLRHVNVGFTGATLSRAHVAEIERELDEVESKDVVIH